MSALGYRKREPEPIAPEVPRTLATIVELHSAKRSINDLAAIALCRDEQQFRRRYLGDRDRRFPGE